LNASRARRIWASTSPRGRLAIVAAAGGVVRFAAELFLTGNTILIDHGYGLETSYAHLSRIDVSRPAPRRASRSASSAPPEGSPGRTSLGMEWFQVRLDPELVVGAMPTRSGIKNT